VWKLTSMEKRLTDFANRSFLITGASSGIGRAVALRAAASGARLALVARRQANLDEVAKLVRQRGGEAHVIVCDVGDRRAALAAVARADELLGGIEVAVLNAGIGRHRTLVEHDLDDAESLLRVNVFGTLYFAHVLSARMLARGTGWLVFMASIGGLLPLPGEAVYAASKFAVVGLAESLAIELAPTVHVLTVCPGAVANTEFVRDDERDRVTRTARTLAITPEDVADATFAGLAAGRTRVIVPAKLGVAVAMRGVLPGVVRRGTARELAPILRRVRAASNGSVDP
jgi:3-oxoacyl-[acyl-carrier protein] reductase